MKVLLPIVAAVFSLAGCAGYQLGDVKPSRLKEIHSIAVLTFTNKTFQPRVGPLVTNTVIKQFQQDGTFQITNPAQADAVLEGEVSAISRGPARFVRGNVLATAEFNLSLTVTYTLKKKDGTVVAGPGQISGSTSFFVGSDVNSEERQALPLATEDLAVRMVSQLTEGW
ncbi:MAG: LPS assembly lipoprotein LptE [Verrucomicrobiota bacterium]|nr:LPS assembly lipoprotein LptE [Verrucomicrobiota bacterium]